VSETSAEVIRRYLQDAVTASKDTEVYLQKLVSEANESEAKQVFQHLALETKTQRERFAARLTELGGSSASIHGLLSHLLGLASKAPHTGPEKDRRTIRNLMAAFATEHGKAALCEAIANMAEAASDYDTADLARSIRDEARTSAQKVWQVLPDWPTEA
jgi:ferritin-like metal-binding protein YciE